MAALAVLSAAIAIVAITSACVTGSAPVLLFGFADLVVGLVAFCRWAWTL
jgi:hypothetical protein